MGKLPLRLDHNYVLTFVHDVAHSDKWQWKSLALKVMALLRAFDLLRNTL